MQANPVETSNSFTTRILCQMTEFCARRSWLTVFVLLASAAGCVYYTCDSLKFKTDRADLIDPHAKFYKRWLRYTELFGESDDIVIVVEAERPETIKQALDEMGSRLTSRPDLFASVLYKVEPGALRAKGLQYLPPEALANGLEQLDAFRPILNGHWELVTLNGVITRLQSQLARLRGETEAEEPLLQHAELLTSSLLKTLRDSNEFSNPWPEVLSVPDDMQDQGNQTDYLLNESGTMGFVMATAVQKKGSFEGPTAAIDLIRENLGEVGRKFQDAKFSLTGISVLENDEMRRSMADSTTASIISFIGVAVLLVLGFRGIRHPALGLLMLAVGMCWSFGYTTLAIGHLNILSVSFAAMLMGLGIDFAVHILSRYLELRHAGQPLLMALVSTTRSVGVGIVTGAITTSLAFFCATLTDFLGVAELGIIAGGGILLCALAAFTILPAVIALADRHVEIQQLPKPFQAKLLRKVTSQHPWIVLIASAACMGYIGYRTFDWSQPVPRLRVVYDHNLLNLQADGLESVEAQRHIFESSKHSLLYALSIVDSAEEARALKKKLEKLGSVRQVQELATRLPEAPTNQIKLLVQGYHAELAHLPDEPPPPMPASPASVGQTLERLHKQLRDRRDPVSREVAKSIDQFLDEFEPKSTQEQVMFLTEFQYRMEYALLAQLKAIASASNPEPVTAADLPEELRTRFVSRDGKWLLQIFPKDQIWDMEPLERFVNEVRSVDPEATGTPLQNYEAARQIKESYEICALYALGVIVITLLLDFSTKITAIGMLFPASLATVAAAAAMQFKQMPFNPGLLLLVFTSVTILVTLFLDPRAMLDSLLAMLPPMLGLSITYGLLVIWGIPLNPANLIILPLILGIGVDNGVHILHDFHANQESRYSTSPSTINAIMLTSTTTMVGFGSMMVSAHRGLYSLGAVLTIGVGACLLISLVMMPSLLAVLGTRKSTIVETLNEIPEPEPTPLNEVPRNPMVIHEPIQVA